MPVCEEHSEVMKCLGALERGQEDMMSLLQKVDIKIDSVTSKQTNGVVSAAIEKTKSSILYWVIAIACSALVGAFVVDLVRFRK